MPSVTRSLECIKTYAPIKIIDIPNLLFILKLLSQEPDRIEVVESEFDWWRPGSNSPSDSEPEEVETRTKVELCVKTERSRTLWSHLSSPEKKKVCELIGYIEGVPRQDKPKQYIGNYNYYKILWQYYIRHKISTIDCNQVYSE